ncbi:MAG: hypothetical protein EOL89_09725 [Actinobacteria bacterium]|nr:hypothetical protein [Actinomycetota bacterium]
MTSRHGYIDIASPWEKANRDNKDAAWVKIQRENGQWIGGWLTHGSLAAAYPEQHQLYIDQQYEMTADGDFGDALTDTGGWIVVGDKDVVSWIKSGRIAAREEQAKQQAEDRLMTDGNGQQGSGSNETTRRLTERGIGSGEYTPPPPPPPARGNGSQASSSSTASENNE